MKISLKIYVFLFSIFFITNLFLKPINANENEKGVKEALGFMIGGDGGWESFSTFHEVKGCNVTYHQMFMGFKLIVNYTTKYHTLDESLMYKCIFIFSVNKFLYYRKN